jgi:hypothetical protein
VLFRAALGTLANRTELVNRIIEVDFDSGAIVLREFELPSS